MRRSFAHIWGPALLGVYIALAAVAAFLLAPSCITQEEPASRYGAVQYFSRMFLAAAVLFIAFVGVGLVLAIAATTFVAWLAEEIRAWKRARRKAR